MVRRANSAKSVLKRQKPKQRSPKNYIKRGLLGLLICSSGFLASFYWLSTPEKLSSASPTQKNGPSRPKSALETARIEIRNDGDLALDGDLIIKIRSATQNALNSSSTDREQLASFIQKMGSFMAVKIAQVDRQTVVVQVSPRVPALCVEADQLRFIGSDGSVYGSPASLQECPAPPVKGILDTGRKYTTREDGTLELTPGEHSALKDSLLLQKSLASYALHAQSIQYIKHRGFTVILQGKSPEITLGYPPFSNRLDKLLSLLEKLAAKGEDALRIELDYQGKAFLKLKKM